MLVSAVVVLLGLALSVFVSSAGVMMEVMLAREVEPG
jgi:hypothetical protein